MVELMPAAIKVDNVSLSGLGIVMFDPALRFYSSLAEDWLPEEDVAAMASPQEPEVSACVILLAFCCPCHPWRQARGVVCTLKRRPAPRVLLFHFLCRPKDGSRR